ncbi:MAG: hypothetical protein A2W90_23170 [Bacteroidetes bacterium GWF2_42_66]|nr:MAG: hypothetical protein A2W92_02985 [Bacteroidetes bacterium GWA2_42_15]OFX99508.1 MAG: hypothetical protein A2W89_12855 [Bacteroidetes bacterium GWE2_42_39]OFY47039.1 MAG: hypothetical protein A2W90_23170 [Bacteroidetes bacterium GWF2_42_66]HAZ04303.1 hypothetical protein [Marinilabiliales bacterium]HBL76802.1 hypothetical protein [Prolixibacteraceae bacterium]
MKVKEIISNTVFVLVFIQSMAFAQETILTSGGNNSTKSGSISYSVGQALYITNSGTLASVAQGVQQPFEISVIQGKEVDITCVAYPNPTIDILKLNVDNFQFYTLYYQLYDILGRLIERKRIISKETLITTKFLMQSTYVLKIADNKKIFKTFKIIKNH